MNLTKTWAPSLQSPVNSRRNDSLAASRTSGGVANLDFCAFGHEQVMDRSRQEPVSGGLALSQSREPLVALLHPKQVFQSFDRMVPFRGGRATC